MPVSRMILRDAARHRGMTLEVADGEYRVAFKGAAGEASAYYTTDADDALRTMCDMYTRAIVAQHKLA